MNLLKYILILFVISSCSNYSINHDFENDTKRVFNNGYNTSESLSEHGSFIYGDVKLENISEDKELTYTIEKKEKIIKEAYIEYTRPFFISKFNNQFYSSVKPYLKTSEIISIDYVNLRPGESKSIGVSNRIEISPGLYMNNNPMGDRNDPRYSSYEYIENSTKGDESYQILQDNPKEKYYKKVKLITYSFDVKGWVNQ